MKVLMLGWELPPHNSGGLGVACKQLCKTLAKKGADITFVVPYDADHSDLSFMKVLPVKIAKTSDISGVYDSAEYTEEYGLSGSVFDIQNRYVAAMDGVVKNHSFQVIHAHDWLTFRAGLRAKELTGKPLILHVHSIESDRAGGKKGNPLVHEIEYIGMLLADQIVAVSELTRQKIIEEYAIPAEKIIVAHNSIDIEDMAPFDGDTSYKVLQKLKNEGYKIIANVGRLTIQKGLTNFLIAAKLVIEREPKSIFLIVGSGDQKRELIELSAQLGIAQHVIFTDFQRGKRWRDAFAVADLFVMPSVSEPFGLTPLEASFYGTPSLISKQSGIAEILHSCLKVDFWDTEKMANDITAVIRHQGLRRVLQENTKSELKRLSWDNAARILMDSYQSHHNARVSV